MSISEPNSMLRLLKKLRSLQGQIRLCVKDKNNLVLNLKKDLKSQLAHINALLDKDRFKSPCDSRFSLDMEFPNKLNVERITDLEQPFTKEEIKGAVWDCSLNKSSGPDDSLLVFSEGGNFSFLTKSQGAKQVKDFRPISLIGSLYKIITKILANHLAIVMGDLVNEVQSAFIANRQILDGPFILNEIIRWSKAKKKQTMIVKVDFEKAFDSVKWDFLDDVLKNFGFVVRWRNWIQSCLKSSWGSILVNGSPTAEFQFHKGQWSDENLIITIRVLECFFHASGLRINLYKSKLLGLAVDNHTVHIAANNLGCLPLSLPFNYLGVKVGARMSSISSWEDVFNKVSQRLSKWKMNMLSIGGRLTLLKSVLGSTPTYFLSMFKAPRQDDTWKGNTPLRIMFPMMYSLESAKTISVAAKLASLNLCSSFHRTLRGGVEQQQFFDLMAFLEGTDLPNMMDRWTWSLSSSFKLDNLPTRLNLSRRGVDLESIFCPICNLAVESSDHILFQCSLVKEIYFKIANWWDIDAVVLSSYIDWWSWFSSIHLSTKLKMILEGVFYIAWARCFGNFSWVDLLKNPSLILL
ncbi:RNA-directed DNA polymerase, eukaryota [Tanacetum coccineum]